MKKIKEIDWNLYQSKRKPGAMMFTHPLALMSVMKIGNWYSKEELDSFYEEIKDYHMDELNRVWDSNLEWRREYEEI